jgi:hypothetical protein
LQHVWPWQLAALKGTSLDDASTATAAGPAQDTPKFCKAALATKFQLFFKKIEVWETGKLPGKLLPQQGSSYLACRSALHTS